MSLAIVYARILVKISLGTDEMVAVSDLVVEVIKSDSVVTRFWRAISSSSVEIQTRDCWPVIYREKFQRAQPPSAARDGGYGNGQR